jgi:5S rRNA maturation endonuclease (ribonuclease M5)
MIDFNDAPLQDTSEPRVQRFAVIDLNNARRQNEIDSIRLGGGVDKEDIRARLHVDPKAFVGWLYSGRAYCTAKEARIGDVRGTPGASLSIALAGHDAGLWHDHATGEGGDLISLFMAYRDYRDASSFNLALHEIARDFFRDQVAPLPQWQQQHNYRSAQHVIEERKAKLGSKPRADMVELGAPVATWKYLDTEGNVIASVSRYEPGGTPESKTFRPFTFKTIDGVRKWVMGAPILRPLYRLPQIALTNQVVLVEGEKCADALCSIGVEATTAMQGAEAPIDKTDWSPLNGKAVTIWPDNDAPGMTYAQKVAERLTSAHGCKVRMVAIPLGKLTKWDAADCIAEGSDAHELVNRARDMPLAPRPRFVLLTLADMLLMRPPPWLVQGFLTERGLSVLWGRSGSLKSFLALDLAATIATGQEWFGRTTRPGLVIYVAAEGGVGFTKRVVGWFASQRGQGMPADNLRVLAQPIALTGTRDELDQLIAAIMTISQRASFVVIDTLARTFGTGDENRQPDMNAFVNATDTLREALGAHVMVVHHSGVHDEKRERGSNVLRAAADTVVKVELHDERMLVINKSPEGKQKDAEEFETIKLRSQKLYFQQGGEEQSTLILMPDDDPLSGLVERKEPIKATAASADITANQKLVLAALKVAGAAGLRRADLMTVTGASRATITRSLPALYTAGLIEPAEGAGRWRISSSQSV